MQSIVSIRLPTIHSLMNTERSFLRYLLLVVFVIFLICGFTVTPIAASKYINQTEYDVTINTGKEAFTSKVTVEDCLAISSASCSGNPVSCEVDTDVSNADIMIHTTDSFRGTSEIASDDITRYINDNHELSVTVGSPSGQKTVTASDINQFVDDHPDAQYIVASDYCFIKVVCHDWNNITAILLEANEEYHGTWKRVIQQTDNGTVLFKVPVDAQYNLLRVTYGEADNVHTGKPQSKCYRVEMPKACETLTFDVYLCTLLDTESSFSPWLPIIIAVVICIAVIAVVAVTLPAAAVEVAAVEAVEASSVASSSMLGSYAGYVMVPLAAG